MIKLKSALVLIIILSVSCSKDRHLKKILPGNSTVRDVLNHLDEPNKIQTSSFNHNEELFVYDNFSIQIDRKMVKAIHRKPASVEKSLQYWRHKYKHYSTSLQPINSKGHEQIWQFKIPSEGLGVVYNESQGEIIRVIEYEVR